MTHWQVLLSGIMGGWESELKPSMPGMKMAESFCETISAEHENDGKFKTTVSAGHQNGDKEYSERDQILIKGDV